MIRRTIRRWLIARAVRKRIRGARLARGLTGPGPCRPNLFFSAAEWVEAGAFTDAPAPIVPAKREPGRQRIPMPEMQLGPFSRPWKPPLPPGAKSAPYEDVHRYTPGGRPRRDAHFGLQHQEPPLSMLCPTCELEQTPLSNHEERTCPYCGLRLRTWGTKVFWWREAVDVPEWRP